MKRLEAASKAVRKATDNLVAAATQALERDEEINVEMNTSAVNSVVEEIDARSKVLEMERELERARRRLENIHKGRYQTDSEPEQSGYESSGYDHTPSQIRKVYTSPFGGAKATSALSSSSRLMQQSTTSGYSYSDRSGDESAIESGPSFNESLQRFRSAAAHSDTEAAAAATEAPVQHSSFKMTSSSSSRQQTQNKTVTRSVEEQTMITRNSQKSYHIE